MDVHLLSENITDHSLPSIVVINILQKITELNYGFIRALKEGPNISGKFDQEFKYTYGLNVKPFKFGSFRIIFTPAAFSNNQTTLVDTWNKKAFDKLFEVLSCGEDITKLNEMQRIIGTYGIVKYRELLKVVYSNELDVLFEEKGRGNSKFILKKENAKNIYNSLKGFDDDSSEDIIKQGILVAADTDRCTFGFTFSDSEERIDGKYDQTLDELVGNNFKNLCKVKLRKTNKFNSKSGESKDYWELLNIL